jgi:hypothetical protein
MPQLFYQDGSAIPDEAIPEAIAKGAAFAKPGAPIAVRDRVTGQLGRIDPSELGNPDYQPLTDAEIDAERIHRERGTLGQQAITAVEGGLDMPTNGISTAALVGALGDDYRKGALERKQENPKTYVGAGLAATAATALLSGGTTAAAAEGSALARGAGSVARVIGAPMNAIGKIGGAVERGISGGIAAESLLGRAASKAVSMGVAGAVEGAVFGAGQTLSDSTLKGDPLTTEAVLAGMGQGALFGGVLGAGLGAAGELAPAALGKLLPSKEKLETSAVGFARKQLGRDFENVGKGQSREVAEGWKDASAKQLLERKLVGGPNAGKTVFEASTKPTDIAVNIGQMADDIGAEVGALHEKAAALIDANPHLAPSAEELIARLESKAVEFQKQHNSGAYAQARAVRAEIRALRDAIESPEGKVAAMSPGAVTDPLESGVENFVYARDGMRDMSVHRGGYEGATAEEVKAIARGETPTKNSRSAFQPVRVHIEPGEPPILNDGRHRLLAAKEAGAKEIAAEVVTYDAAGNAISKEMRMLPIEASPSVSAGAVANDVAPSFGYNQIRQWQQDLHGQINPKDVPDSMRAAAVKNLAAREAVNEVTKDYIKETAAKVFAETGAAEATALAQLNSEYAGAISMRHAAEKEAERSLKNRRASITDHMLGIGSGLIAMSSGNMGALGTMALGGAAAIGNKMAREQGNAIMAQIARRAARMTSLVDGAAHALSGTGEKLIAPVKVVIEAERPAPYNPKSQTELKTNFAEVRDRLQELSRPEHQQAQLAHATGRVQTAYPEIANALNLHLLKAQAYLSSQLPQPRGGSPISPLARAATVPPREMQKFLSKTNAVMAPETVIADIAKGKLDDDAIGALKEVYPETFGALRSATIRYTAANKEEMPFARVVHVSRLFDFPGDSSMGPRFAGIQEAIQGMDKPLEQNPSPQGGPPMPRLKGPTMKPGEDMTLPSAHAPGSR